GYSAPQRFQCPQSNLSLNLWLSPEPAIKDPASLKRVAISLLIQRGEMDGRDESIIEAFGRFQVHLFHPNNGVGKFIQTSATGDLDVISYSNKVSGT
ncbi:hypothetical protein DBR06_SOUSAS3410069, partial [Sousa chinensis]